MVAEKEGRERKGGEKERRESGIKRDSAATTLEQGDIVNMKKRRLVSQKLTTNKTHHAPLFSSVPKLSQNSTRSNPSTQKASVTIRNTTKLVPFSQTKPSNRDPPPLLINIIPEKKSSMAHLDLRKRKEKVCKQVISRSWGRSCIDKALVEAEEVIEESLLQLPIEDRSEECAKNWYYKCVFLHSKEASSSGVSEKEKSKIGKATSSSLQEVTNPLTRPSIIHFDDVHVCTVIRRPSSQN